MRTYRCTSLDCGESFALERGKDKALPGTVYCPFCRNDAKTYTDAGGLGIVRKTQLSGGIGAGRGN
jgi:hypothetical protein